MIYLQGARTADSVVDPTEFKMQSTDLPRGRDQARGRPYPTHGMAPVRSSGYTTQSPRQSIDEHQPSQVLLPRITSLHRS